MIREQVNRFKDRRSFKEIIPPRTRLNTIVRYEFAQSPVYNSRLIISKQNIDLLSLCKKSGSWVSIKFFKNKISIWTSKNLRYFKKISSSN